MKLPGEECIRFSDATPAVKPIPAPTPAPAPPADVGPPVVPDPGPPAEIVDVNSDLICGPENPNYALGGATTEQKNRIIQAYYEIPQGMGRCPEPEGWVFWQNHLTGNAPAQRIYSMEEVVAMIYQQGTINETQTQSRINVDTSCKLAADRVIGSGKYSTAKFRDGSGNKCSITY